MTFSSTTTGTSGNWFRTLHSNRAFDFSNRLYVYSDAEAPEHVPFRDSVYNDGVAANEVPNTTAITIVDLYRGGDTAPSGVIDGEGDVVGSLDISSDTVSGVVSSPFPRSGDAVKLFTLVDRGYYTRTQINEGESGIDLKMTTTILLIRVLCRPTVAPRHVTQTDFLL